MDHLIIILFFAYFCIPIDNSKRNVSASKINKNSLENVYNTSVNVIKKYIQQNKLPLILALLHPLISIKIYIKRFHDTIIHVKIIQEIIRPVKIIIIQGVIIKYKNKFILI